MLFKPKFWKLQCFALCFITATSAFAQGNMLITQPKIDSISTQQIDEENYILINGIKQWVTIKGDTSKPAILFLHGGPGSVMSPYTDQLYKNWEKEFVLIQWDQRGAGRTFGLNAPVELTPEYLQANPLTLEQIANDGIALTEFLCKHLGKRKLILFGTSWGSALGVTIASKRPDLFYAYVGHSQIVNPSSDESLYDKVYQKAIKSNDTESLDKLNSLGKPPYSRAKTVGQLWKIVKKYEREGSVPAPVFWFVEASEYDNPKDAQDREDGDDYSFVNFVGDEQLGIASMRSSIDFLKNNTIFETPVYLIQGEEDLLTPKESTKMYFDKLKAPKKNYILLPKTAHGFNKSVVEAQYDIFRRIKAF